MDEVKIISKLMRGVISKILSRAINKNLGIRADLQIRKIEASINEEKVHIHLDIDADITKDELDKLLGKYGLLG